MASFLNWFRPEQKTKVEIEQAKKQYDAAQRQFAAKRKELNDAIGRALDEMTHSKEDSDD